MHVIDQEINDLADKNVITWRIFFTQTTTQTIGFKPK